MAGRPLHYYVPFTGRQNCKNNFFEKMRTRVPVRPDFPVCVCGKKSKGRVITRKPILPSDEEMEENPRSKSAKLRIFEKKV